jgi:predicted CopG family antitoxin
MATKTISIDTEAYRRLKSVQQKNESFSQTIKRVVQQPIDFDAWMASMEKDPLSEKAVAAVEAIVLQRQNRRNRRRPRGAA